MDWILARPRARARAAALSNRSIKDSRPVAGSEQGADASLAQPRYDLDYATWYAALSGHNDGRQGNRAAAGGADAAPSVDLYYLLNAEVEAA